MEREVILHKKYAVQKGSGVRQENSTPNQGPRSCEGAKFRYESEEAASSEENAPDLCGGGVHIEHGPMIVASVMLVIECALQLYAAYFGMRLYQLVVEGVKVAEVHVYDHVSYYRWLRHSRRPHGSSDVFLLWEEGAE